MGCVGGYVSLRLRLSSDEDGDGDVVVGNRVEEQSYVRCQGGGGTPSRKSSDDSCQLRRDQGNWWGGISLGAVLTAPIFDPASSESGSVFVRRPSLPLPVKSIIRTAAAEAAVSTATIRWSGVCAPVAVRCDLPVWSARW